MFTISIKDHQTFLEQSGKMSTEKYLATEIFKKINDLNLSLVKNYSKLRQTRVRHNATLVKAHKSATFGDTSLTRKTYNALPQEPKVEISYKKTVHNSLICDYPLPIHKDFRWK